MRFFILVGAATVCTIGAVGVWYLIKNVSLIDETKKGKRK